jgi:hypothetical protein
MYYLEGYMTYYPGSFIFSGAKPIVVGVRTPTGCPFEIPLGPTGCKTTTVSGHIAATPGNPDAKYKIAFYETNQAGGSIRTGYAGNSALSYKPGEDFAAAVCPGSYDVVLTDDQTVYGGGHLPEHKVIFDSLHVEAGPTAVDGVELTPRAMASISGEVPGMTQSLACPSFGPRLHVSILREGDGQFQTADLDGNRFSFRNVAPGNYVVYIGQFAREAFYLDSILVDAKPIAGRKFTVADAKPMTIAIHLSNDSAHAAGHLFPDIRREPQWEVAWTRPKAGIAGKVLGAGASGATVKLLAARFNSSASAEYTVQTADEGSFRFDTVDPGVYTVRVEGKSILTTEYGALEPLERGTPVVVERGAHVEGLMLSPPKLSAICGVVTDSAGKPQPGPLVLMQRARRAPDWGVWHGPPTVSTDADGRFRFDGISPGEYFPASPFDGNRNVFFSNDGTLGAATPVAVQAGKDVGCGGGPLLELRAPPNYRATYRFSGTVTGDLPASAGDRFWVELIDKRAAGAPNYVARANLDAGHRFSFYQAPGGKYLLQLYGAYGPEPLAWSGRYGPVSHLLASQPVDVHDELTEVTVTPTLLSEVTGTVHFDHVPEAWGKNFDIVSQQITLVPREYRQPLSTKLSADGSFRIAAVDAGDYEVNLNLRVPPLYIRSVRLDGREIEGRYFHLNAVTSAKLEIEVRDDSGQVNARILPDGSLPTAEPSIRETCSKSSTPAYTVILFPDPLPAAGAENGRDSASPVWPRPLQGVEYGGTPRVQILSVPPGHYRALAMQVVDQSLRWPFETWDDVTDFRPRLWDVLATLAEPITVPAGGTVELSLPDKTFGVLRVAATIGAPLDRSFFDR